MGSRCKAHFNHPKKIFTSWSVCCVEKIHTTLHQSDCPFFWHYIFSTVEPLYPSLLLQTEAVLIGDYGGEQIDYRYVLLYDSNLKKKKKKKHILSLLMFLIIRGRCFWFLSVSNRLTWHQPTGCFMFLWVFTAANVMIYKLNIESLCVVTRSWHVNVTFLGIKSTDVFFYKYSDFW